MTAVTSVESTGLLLAAVATGSVAMPLNEPLPSLGTAVQATPKGWLIASVVELLDAVVGADLLVEGAATAPLAAGVFVEPHAASPIGSAAARATKTVARRAVLVRAFMMFLLPYVVCGVVAYRWYSGCSQRWIGLMSLGFRHETMTTTCWMPLDPSGNGVARWSVCRAPVRSVARTARVCWPVVASHGTNHCRQ